MYYKPGAGGGALATCNTYGCSVFSDDTLRLVGAYRGRKWERLKEFLRDDWDRTETDFRAVRECAKTTSKAAKDAIKKTYDWTGPWLAATAGIAGGLAYMCARYPHEYDWVKGEVLCGMVGTGMQLYRHVKARHERGIEGSDALGDGVNMEAKNPEAERIEMNRIRQIVKSDYTTLMKQLASKDWASSEKINLRYLMKVDGLTKKMGDDAGSPDETRKDLENARITYERYIETRDGSHHGSIGEEFESKAA